MRRVRQMRDTILKRRTRIDEVQVKGPSRELARLQTDKERADAQNKAWLDNLENNDNSGNICMYCGKKFERRAVLLSHQKSCQQKKKSNSRPSLTKKAADGDKQNGWNIRDYDDSSNSNSLDGAYIDENTMSATTMAATTTTTTERTIKTEKVLKTEPESSGDALEQTSTNKRKRNRAIKAIVPEDTNQSSDDKSLNVCWNADASFEIKEERLTPPDAEIDSDSGSNLNVNATWSSSIDPETQMNIYTIEDVRSSDRKCRSSNNANKIAEIKAKEKTSTSHCKYCLKKFSNASNLRRHITMLHFRPTKFTCTLCPSDAFRSHKKIDVITHLRAKHKFDGERTDAMKFMSVKDEPIPKPPSINRRKERHTEVLKDDDEEMFMENEPLISGEDVIENFAGSDGWTENSNADADADDNIATNTIEPIDDAESNEMGSSKTRKGRPKTITKSLEEISLLLDDNKKDSQSLPAKRPVRNRTMPVKKDFVYDLSTLLKQQQQELQKQITQQLQLATATQAKSRNTSPTPIDNNKATKRRNTLPETQSTIVDIDSDQNQLQQQQSTPQQPSSVDYQSKDDPKSIQNSTAINSELIKGAADAMAQKAIKANRAALCELPELPAERVSIISTTQRTFDPAIMKEWPILKRSASLNDGSNKSTTANQTNQKVPGLKRKKRSCLLKYSSNKSIHHKSRFHSNRHKISGSNGNIDNHEPRKETSDTMKISSKIADKIQLQIDENIKTPNRQSNGNDIKTPTANKNAEAPMRRMTLLERLAENKTKKLNESLSRMTIGKNDYDSDDD